MSRAARWSSYACAIHCLALPLFALVLAGAEEWHETPALRLVESIMIVVALSNGARLSLLLQRMERTWLSLSGVACVAFVMVCFLFGWHPGLIIGMLALAAFQFRAHREECAHHDCSP